MLLTNKAGNVIKNPRTKAMEDYLRKQGYVDYVAPKKEKPKTTKAKQVKVEEPTEE